MLCCSQALYIHQNLTIGQLSSVLFTKYSNQNFKRTHSRSVILLWQQSKNNFNFNRAPRAGLLLFALSKPPLINFANLLVVNSLNFETIFRIIIFSNATFDSGVRGVLSMGLIWRTCTIKDLTSLFNKIEFSPPSDIKYIRTYTNWSLVNRWMLA